MSADEGWSWRDKAREWRARAEYAEMKVAAAREALEQIDQLAARPAVNEIARTALARLAASRPVEETP